MEALSLPARALRVRRATARLCLGLDWMPLHEVSLPDGHRADILALRADGGFAILEIKSGPRDFLTDTKWPAYRAWCDALYFAVDAEFPHGILPADAGLVVAAGDGAALLREAPAHPLAAARRRSLTHRFARLAGLRLAAAEDPAGAIERRAALRVE